MKIEEECYSKLKMNCFCKEKGISRKANQRIKAKKTFYSPCKIVKIMLPLLYQVRRHADVISISYNKSWKTEYISRT